MEITNDIILYVEGLSIDDETRQNLYLKFLNMSEREEEFPSEEYMQNWVWSCLTKMQSHHNQVEYNRQRILMESKEEIAMGLGVDPDGAAPDPMDLLIAEEEFENKLKELSPLLRVTLERVVIDGAEPEDVAVEEGTSVNVIYQRVHKAKEILRGNSNE